jgi:hypothetical protein
MTYLIKLLAILSFTIFCPSDATFVSNCNNTANRTLNLTANLINSSYPLIAGQTILVGVVQLDLNNTHLSVTYRTISNWTISDVHMWVGANRTGYPSTPTGNPQIGLFPYSGSAGGTNYFRFTVGLSFSSIFSNMCRYCNSTQPFYLMTHAVVTKTGQTETAWGSGDRVVAQGNWALIRTAVVAISCQSNRTNGTTTNGTTTNGTTTNGTTTNGTTTNGTIGSDPSNRDIDQQECGCGGEDSAMAKDPCSDRATEAYSRARCLLDMGLTRWGWINGPYGDGYFRLDMWAGATQCSLGNGYHIGSIFVNHTDQTVVVRYVADSGYLFSGLRLYVGQCDPINLASNTHSSQYDGTAVVDYTFNVSNVSGSVCVIAQAVVCII